MAGQETGRTPQEIIFYLRPEEMRDLHNAFDKFDESLGWDGVSDIKLPTQEHIIFRLAGTIE